MWELHQVEKGSRAGWQKIGHFETVTAVVSRIIELEEYPVTGLHLEMYVDAAHGSDSEAFGHLEFTGRRALYALKRVVQ